MAGASKHWADVYSWIHVVIDSCNTVQHVISAKRLVKLFKQQYCKPSSNSYVEILYEVLRIKCDHKLSEVIKIQKTENDSSASN